MDSVRELWSFLLIFTIYLFVSVLAATDGLNPPLCLA